MHNPLQLGLNLIELRKTLGLKVSDFAESFGVQYRTYQSYERGERRPQTEFLTQLVHDFNVNINWLLTGTGPMFLPQQTEKQQKYEQAFSERKTFGKRLNYYQGEENLNDIEIAKIMGASESRVEKLGLDKTEPTLAELRALKSHSGISIDLWLDGDLKDDSNSIPQTLSAEEQKMLEFLKKAKKNNLL